MKISKNLISALQGLYFFPTGIWPLLHMPSFLAVTGPKTDLWLVKTVSILLAIIGLVLLLAGVKKRVSPEIVLLGTGSAAALIAIDIYYSLQNVISDIYQYDAVAEVIIILLWLIAIGKHRKTNPEESINLKN